MATLPAKGNDRCLLRQEQREERRLPNHDKNVNPLSVLAMFERETEDSLPSSYVKLFFD